MTGTDAVPGDVDLWGQVVGQDGAVAQLRAAARNPVHAYLLVGPEGSGKRAAAHAFAAELLAAGTDPAEQERTRRLVATENHPALVVVERVGASITVDQADEIVRNASRSAAEGSIQVFVLVDFHLVGPAASKLLKTIEEPPPGTYFVVLAEVITPELVTIASRCVTIEFPTVPNSAILGELVRGGVDPEVAAAAATSAGGSMSRARLLAHDPGVSARRAAWYSAPEQLDGSGGAASDVVDRLLEGVDELLVPLLERQAAEVAELEATEAAVGERRLGDRNRLDARHKREQRRIRTDELRFGLATLVARYRDELVRGGSVEDFLAVADAVQVLCDGLVFNPNEPLQLRALFVSLPRVAS